MQKKYRITTNGNKFKVEMQIGWIFKKWVGYYDHLCKAAMANSVPGVGYNPIPCGVYNTEEKAQEFIDSLEHVKGWYPLHEVNGIRVEVKNP